MIDGLSLFIIFALCKNVLSAFRNPNMSVSSDRVEFLSFCLIYKDLNYNIEGFLQKLQRPLIKSSLKAYLIQKRSRSKTLCAEQEKS